MYLKSSYIVNMLTAHKELDFDGPIQQLLLKPNIRHA